MQSQTRIKTDSLNSRRRLRRTYTAPRCRSVFQEWRAKLASARLRGRRILAIGAIVLFCGVACATTRAIRTSAVVLHKGVHRTPMDVAYFGEDWIMPVVELTMSGRTVRFVLDSGANIIAVSREFAVANRLPRRGRSRVKLAAGSAVTDIVGLPEFDFGGAVIPAQEGGVFDFLDEANKTYGCRIDGVMGTALFNHAIVRWNYPEGWAEVRAANNPVKDDGFTYESMHRRGWQTWVMADVGGRGGSGLFLLDTGFAGALTGTTDSFVAQRISNLDEIRRVGDLDGVFWEGRLPKVSFGGVTFEDVPIALSVGDIDANGLNPKLGSALFRHAELIVDFARNRFGVRNIAGSERRAGRWGLEVKRQRGALRISRLAVAGPAVNAGLRIGDVVKTLDGRVAPDNACEFYRSLSERDEVTLGLTRGRENLKMFIARAQHLPVATFR